MNSSHQVQLYLYRHGETDWNRLGRMQGRADIELNEFGLRQAELVRKFFDDHFLKSSFASMTREELWAGAVSSPLLRAQATARIAVGLAGAELCRSGTDILLDARWSETHLGLAEGLTRDELLERFGEEPWRAWIGLSEASWQAKFPEGESKGDVRDRALAAMVDLVGLSQSDPKAPRVWTVATHGGLLRRLLHHFHPNESEPIDVPNGSVFKFIFEAGTWCVSKRPIYQPDEN